MLRGVTLSKIRLVYIYFFALFLFCITYFIESPVKELRIYEKITQYFGITLIPLSLFFIFYGLLFFCKDAIKRLVYEIKLYFILIVVILGFYTYIIYNSGLDFSNLESINLNEEYYRVLIEDCIYNYKIGYLPTYVLWLILNLRFPFQNIIYAMLLIQVLLTFLVIYIPLKNHILNSYRAYKKRKRLAEEERLLYEQIKIKESLEKKEALKKIKFRENREKLLEEKVEFFRTHTQLKKMVNINEEIGEENDIGI